MSQNDFIIDNQTFPNFRVDLNDALQALASSSSGSLAPTTTYAYMLWYDTSNDILKMRTGADDGWINLMNFDQGADTAVPSTSNVLDEDNFDSNSATRPPSQQSTKAYVDNSSIGAGQTWQDVSASRVINTSYQNTTGKLIFVSIYASSNGGPSEGIQVSADNSTWVLVTGSSNVSGSNSFAAVPTGHYYRWNGSTTIINWAELR